MIFQYVLLIFSLSSISAPQHPSDKNRNTNKAEVEQRASSKIVTYAIGAVNNTPNAQEEHGHNAVKNVEDAFAVFFTAVIAIVGIWQWRTRKRHEFWMRKNVLLAQRMAADTQKAFRLAQRAEILLDNIILQSHPTTPNFSHVECSIKNFGRSIANVAGIFKMLIAGEKNSEIAFSSITLGGGKSHTVSFGRFCNILESGKTFEKVQGQLRVMGEMTYTDAFGDYSAQWSATFEPDKQHFIIDENG